MPDRPLSEIAAGLNNVLAINFYGRSGSVYVQSLFDGHPRTITSAGVYLHFLYGFHSRHSHLPRQQFLDLFLQEFAAIFDSRLPFNMWGKDLSSDLGLTRMGENRAQFLTLDRDKFTQVLNTIADEIGSLTSSKVFFQAVHLAYHLALHRTIPVEASPLIVFPMHNMYAPLSEIFFKDFPQVKCLHTVREPLTSLTSLLKQAQEEFPWVLEQLLEAKPHSDACRYLKLEDLNNKPDESLKLLCNWLELEWDDCLLVSSFHNLRWWGEGGTSDKHTAQPEFNRLDRFRLKTLLQPRYEQFNYFIDKNYSRWSGRVLTLLSLPLPFVVEYTNITVRRNLKLNRSRENPLKDSFRRFLCRSYLFVAIDYLKARKRLLRSWSRLFKKQQDRNNQILSEVERDKG